MSSAEPPDRLAGARVGHEVDAGQVGEGLAVGGVDGAAPRDPLVELAQLAGAEGRQEVAEPVVEAHLGVLVVQHRLPGLRGEVAGPLDQRGVVGDEHAAAAGGDDLVAVEREHRHEAEAARGPAVVGGAEGLGGVLDQDHVVLGARGGDGVEVGHLPVEVDGHHGAGQVAARGRVVQLGAHEVGVEVPAAGLGVDEHRGGAEVGHRVGRGGEGEVGHQHPVARADAGQVQGQVQRGGAARQGRGMGAARVPGPGGLELGQGGSGRCQPARVERGHDGRPVVVGDVRRRQQDVRRAVVRLGCGHRVRVRAPRPVGTPVSAAHR